MLWVECRTVTLVRPAGRDREICGGLACCVGKMRHLGLDDAPRRSTLCYANAHRPWQLYEELFYQILQTCRSGAPQKHKFRFKNKLLSLDSSTIILCLSLFPWAQYVQTKGAIKLHLLLDHDGYLPEYAYISNGKVSDIAVARRLTLQPGSIVAMDRGYTDYALQESGGQVLFFASPITSTSYTSEKLWIPV